MKRITIGFWDTECMLRFVKITGRYQQEINLICGSYAIDAKSLLAVFSIKAAEHIEILIHGEDCDELLMQLDSYIQYGEMLKKEKLFDMGCTVSG